MSVGDPRMERTRTLVWGLTAVLFLVLTVVALVKGRTAIGAILAAFTVVNVAVCVALARRR